MRVLSSLGVLIVVWLQALAGQAPAESGRKIFTEQCALCHGVDAAGGTVAATILPRIAALDDAALESAIRNGVPARGMPAFALKPSELTAVVAYLRALRIPASRGRRDRLELLHAETTTGEAIDGLVIRQSFEDLQLRLANGSIRLFRRAGDRLRPVTSDTDWPGYDGAERGYRSTTLTGIGPANVGQLAPRWIFTVADTSPLETTPIVSDGIMFVTSGNQCYALDAGTGRQIWRFSRPLTKGLVGNAAGGINRGAAVDRAHVYMTTDHAHLLALDRNTGEVAWETVMADARENYSATGAPLLAGGLVVAGVAGGDGGARGFLAAYDPNTGREAWRFWTTPAPGEPGASTWEGPALQHPGGPTWLTGSYDPELETLYWTTGNPGSDLNGDLRTGDNLYADSLLALDVHTGRLKWYYQFTPHNVWDWDGQAPLALIDARWVGQPRKLVVQANRNGFFYVLDRTNGELLLGRPFAAKLTWAEGIGVDGRPIRRPGQEPTAEGTRVCPSLIGATNWWSTSYLPQTGLYYVQTLESCGIFTKREDEWTTGRVYMGGGTSNAPDVRPQKILRAIDIRDGRVAWALPQIGDGSTRSGTLATASGLVFFGEDSGALMAVDASSGKPLWHFQTSQMLRASPMTYSFDGRQYVAIAAGPNILAFALGTN
ncbi:MAG TPA: PQQ-binding-like beta-propeller repeat protein [Vicinamibacterales bacterium]|nr:PQQ-binding-like beta-propeller repeat protein [Vicinamibacterales bacterium]